MRQPIWRRDCYSHCQYSLYSAYRHQRHHHTLQWQRHYIDCHWRLSGHRCYLSVGHRQYRGYQSDRRCYVRILLRHSIIYYYLLGIGDRSCAMRQPVWRRDCYSDCQYTIYSTVHYQWLQRYMPGGIYHTDSLGRYTRYRSAVCMGNRYGGYGCIPDIYIYYGYSDSICYYYLLGVSDGRCCSMYQPCRQSDQDDHGGHTIYGSDRHQWHYSDM